MPKATKKKKKTKTKRTVTCGKCNDTGHNARTCPTKDKAPETKAETPKAPKPPKKVPGKRDRKSPTADMGSKSSAAPYRCKKCEQVAILVIVRVSDPNETFRQKKPVFMGQMRCELCMNKPNPADLILVWGAKPGDKVTAEIANA
jgi:hypothetical protein